MYFDTYFFIVIAQIWRSKDTVNATQAVNPALDGACHSWKRRIFTQWRFHLR
jgi:hypothetical protein